MSFLPPVVMELRANASQFLSEQGKVVAAAKATASETEKAAQKEAAAARTAAAEATRASEQQVLAAESAAKGATVATDKRILAEERAAAAQSKAAQMQAESLGAMTAEQSAAYDKQAASAARAANAAELAAAREAQAQDKAAAAATASAAAQTKAADLQVVAAEKSAAAQEVAAGRSSAAMKSVMGIAGKVSAVAILAGTAVALGATEMAAHFEKSTMLLVTAGGEQMAALDSVRKGILDISTATGTSAEQMSEGMYIMEKAGYRGAAGLAALKAAAQGAKDENVELSIMSQAVTDVLLDYGYKMDNAKDATDSSVRVTNMLVAASGAAKTTMTDFANSMAAVIPIGSTAKISFDQLGGAIATMTQHGQSAQQSSQNLANLVQSLVRPNNLASAAMSQLGIDTTDLAQHLGERGLSGSLQLVSDAILKHMGPDGMVLQSTMKENANATAAMNTIIDQMPPGLANLSRGLLDGTTSIKQYSVAVQKSGGHAGALGLQLAGLYKANEGVNNSLKAGRPAVETYNAAMRDVYGNVTAARAATMLMMNDSHEFIANIKAIGDAGQKTGDDIATWADMQDTLSVQMDQTKEMVSNLGIELGTKLIPYAKGAASGFRDLVHGFEEGNPTLLTAAGILGGAVALAITAYTTKLVVAGITTTVEMTKMAYTVSASVAKQIASWVMLEANAVASGAALEKVVAGLSTWPGKFKAAAMAAAVLAEGLALMTNSKADVSIDQISNALGGLSDQADSTKDIDAIFTRWDTNLFSHAPADVNNMADAVKRLANKDGIDQFTQSFDGMSKAMGLGEAGISKVEDRFKDMGTALAQMVTSGNSDQAAESFKKLAKTFEDNGSSAEKALDAMPAYRDQLIQLAHDSGVASISGDSLVQLAGGKIPPAMAKAAQATADASKAAQDGKKKQEDLGTALQNAGVSADGLADDLSKVLDGMLATGMATLSSRDATTKFNKSITDAKGAVDQLVKSNVDVSDALNATGTDFNLTSESGQALNAKFEDVMRSGLDMAKSVAGPGVDAQQKVQGALQQTYDNLVTSAHGMGITGGKADDLARSVLGIPPGTDIKTWMDDYARQKAADTKMALDNIPKDVAISVHLYGADQIAAAQASVDALQHAAGNAMVAANQFASGNAYSGGNGPGGYTGGAVASIMGFAGGGMIPGTPPAAPNVDNILAMVNGKPLKVRSGEFINNEPSTKMNLPWLKASNAGLNIGDAMQSRFAAGIAIGQAQPAMAGASSSNTNITVNAQTNATADHIASEVAWALRTQ